MNVVYADSLFWDGRAKDLESQALAPLTNPVEHALSSEGAVADVVRGDHDFARTFAQVFHTQPALITAGMVSRALSAYERSLIAADSPFDRYLYGHDTQALTPAAARGLDLFRGRAQCASCHAIGTTAALLTDGEFHISPSGVPAVVNANLGALASKVVATANSGHRRELEQLIATDRDIAALGRFIVTLNPADIGKFKTPSLRNVALTAPYMHDGSVATLERAVELESYGRGKALNYPIPLTVGEREDLVEFLRTLTSPYARQRPPPE
jgi:cytochrome c peroxidase